MTVITPDKVQYGDKVSINGEAMLVKDVQADAHGAYDFYLTNGVRDFHKVVTEPVEVIP